MSSEKRVYDDIDGFCALWHFCAGKDDGIGC
jgi:hypothetical protein